MSSDVKTWHRETECLKVRCAFSGIVQNPVSESYFPYYELEFDKEFAIYNFTVFLPGK